MRVQQLLKDYVGSQNIELYEKRIVKPLFSKKEKIKWKRVRESEINNLSALEEFPQYLDNECKIRLWADHINHQTSILIFLQNNPIREG